MTYECRNRRCIQGTLLCNGQNNCGDWSDEVGCDVSGPGVIGIVLGAMGLVIATIVIMTLIRKSHSADPETVSRYTFGKYQVFYYI